MDRRSLSLGLAVVAITSIAGTANAQFFFPNNLVVNRIGDGSGTLGNAAFSSTLVEYTRTGSPTGASVTLNAGATGTRLTNSGTATSEGILSSTADQRYILNAGYNAASGVAGVASSTGATNTRVIGITDTWTGTTTYSAFDTTAFSGNNIRSAAAVSITGPTSAIFGAGGVGGIRQTTVTGGGAGTQVGAAAPTNFRVVKSFNFGSGDVLFASNNSGTSGTNSGLALIGASSNTSIVGNGTTTTNALVAITANSVYDFFFANDRTLYLADDRATGGLYKLARTGGATGDVTTGSWAVVYNVAAGATGLRGLAGEVVGNTVNLFGTTTETSANRLVAYSETLSAATAGSFTTIATSAANTVFRGVTLVPTPGSAALLGLGGLLAARRRRA